MTAPTTFMFRSGQYSLAADPKTGEPRYDAYTPDIYAHVARRTRWRYRWWISAGVDGLAIGYGLAWTARGAEVKAIAAAHRPDLLRGAR